MTTERSTDGYDLIYTAYYGDIGEGSIFQASPLMAVKAELEIKTKIRQGINSGEVTIDDLINFIAHTKIAHAISLTGYVSRPKR